LGALTSLACAVCGCSSSLFWLVCAPVWLLLPPRCCVGLGCEVGSVPCVCLSVSCFVSSPFIVSPLRLFVTPHSSPLDHAKSNKAKRFKKTIFNFNLQFVLSTHPRPWNIQCIIRDSLLQVVQQRNNPSQTCMVNPQTVEITFEILNQLQLMNTHKSGVSNPFCTLILTHNKIEHGILIAEV
jgi:hypothetical protein